MQAYDPEFWRGKRVLLTGHTGFKGAWLALWLQKMGADVTGMALAQTERASIFHRARVADGMQSHLLDLRDADAVMRQVMEARPQIVLHLAAQPLVGMAYADPVASYATNVMGTAHLLDAVRRCDGTKVVTVITTDKCYENREWDYPYRETDVLGGKEPYGNSKACQELVTEAFRRSYLAGAGVSVATARAGNVIGGGDWSVDRIIPDCLRAFQDGRPVVLRRPEATRPWQHVLDPLAGYLELAWRQWTAPQTVSEAWNFGPRQEGQLAVLDVVQRLIHHWGEGACEVDRTTARFPEAGLLALDISKAVRHLQWRPRLEADSAIRWTADWYRAARDPAADMQRVSLTQIDDYLRTSSA